VSAWHFVQWYFVRTPYYTVGDIGKWMGANRLQATAQCGKEEIPVKKG